MSDKHIKICDCCGCIISKKAVISVSSLGGENWAGERCGWNRDFCGVDCILEYREKILAKEDNDKKTFCERLSKSFRVFFRLC